MKWFSFAALAGLVLLAGCGKSERAGQAPATNTAAAGNNPITAPVDYLGAAAKAKQVSEATIDTASLNHAIQLFNTEEGRYPKDLQELVTEQYLPRLPEAPYGKKLVYDPVRGEVKVVSQ